MRRNTLSITAGTFGLLALAVPASADFINVDIQELDLGAPEGFVTYRVIAHFEGPDVVLAWGGLPDLCELHFFTGDDVDLLNAGGKFAGTGQEDFAAFPISEAYDSWVTVGATELAGNATAVTSGFLQRGNDDGGNAVEGHELWETDGLVYNANPKNPWFGPDVVMAQFTIPGVPGGLPGDKGHNGFHLEGMVGWALAGAGGFASTFLVDNITEPCPWDIDGSGIVGAADLLALLFDWGPCKGCAADFDGDGIVGASDLLALLFNWGPCP